MQSKVKNLKSKAKKGIFGEAKNSQLPTTNYQLPTSGGITLMEILIVISIVVIISVITFGAFSRYKKSQAVDANSRKILTALEEARGNTLDSLDGSEYGVRFYIEYAEVFKGASYSESGIFRTYALDEPVIIEEVSVGGGSDVVFERLTGRTANSGFVRIGAEGPDTFDRQITIEATGLSYVEE